MPVSRYTNLDDICITKVYRKIRNDHTFSYRGKLYFIDSPLKHSIANLKIEIRSGKNKRFDTYFAGRKLQVLIGTAMDPFHWRRNGPTPFVP